MSHFKCPKCGDMHHLEIEIEVVVQLRQDESDEDNFQTEYTGGDHYWTNDSNAYCNSCEWSGTVLDTIVEI